MRDFEEALTLAIKVGRLQGCLHTCEQHATRTEQMLRSLRAELVAMRDRAVTAETKLELAEKSLQLIEDINL